MRKIKIPLFLAPIAIILVVIFAPRLFVTQENNGGEKVIMLGKTKITVEVADTDEERTKGLSGRPSLSQDRGMLFVFSRKDRYYFWMKGMRFPLDFVWIDDNKVVDLTPNVPYPKDGKPLVNIMPKIPVDKVLEVNAGVINSSQVKIGDQLADF